MDDKHRAISGDVVDECAARAAELVVAATSCSQAGDEVEASIPLL
jgi:hypothetical protein